MKFKTTMLAILAVFFAPALCFAQAAVPPAGLAGLGSLLGKIPGSVPGYMMAIIVFGVELILRFLPTVKPQSLLIYIGYLFSMLGQGFTKLSALIDQIAQNVKDPTPKL